MLRKSRFFAHSAMCHFCCRVTRGEMFFSGDGEPEWPLSELLRVKQRYGLSRLASAIMGDHHLAALRTADVPLWRTMLSLQSRFARRYNRDRGVQGPLCRAGPRRGLHQCIEVKSPRSLGKRDLKGLRAFLDECPDGALFGVVLYAGRDWMRSARNVVAIPWLEPLGR
jgi:hypothetical protein